MMYTFVSVGLENDYSIYSLSHQHCDDVNVYFCKAPETTIKGVKGFLFRTHNSQRLNARFCMPFRRIWKKCLVDNAIASKISDTKELCFIFSGKCFRYISMGCLDYLRKRYSGCKLIYTFTDKVTLYKRNYTDFDLNEIKRRFDLVLTYNSIDARQYDLQLTPPKIKDYSDVTADDIDKVYDVFYIGREKGRLQEIFDVYRMCEDAGLKCYFHLVDVPEEKRMNFSGIEYGEYIAYEQMLRLEKKAICILNIVQEGASGITMRDYEAIGMNKFLITNGSTIKKTEFYTPEKIIFIDELPNGLSKINSTNEKVAWNGSEKYSVNNYYQWLDSELRKLK